MALPDERIGAASSTGRVGAAAPERSASEAFPKRFRVRVRRDFLRIQGQGQRLHGKRLVFQFLPGRTPVSRLGITVSKKVGGSVERNQIKRWIREVFRRHPELRPDGRKHAYDLVITAKSGVTDFAFAHLEAEILSVIGRWLAQRQQRPPRPPRPSGERS